MFNKTEQKVNNSVTSMHVTNIPTKKEIKIKQFWGIEELEQYLTVMNDTGYDIELQTYSYKPPMSLDNIGFAFVVICTKEWEGMKKE